MGSSPLSRGILRHELCLAGHHRIIPALAGNTPELQGVRVFSGDHPRSRGEYSRCWMITQTTVGSSPLSRGIHEHDEFLLMTQRIIPALAGNTKFCSTDIISLWDHPRSRGEYTQSGGRSPPSTGSSPLSRGILPPGTLRPVDWRIIPALAGNTRSPGTIRAHKADHPRSRGEYSGQRGKNNEPLGSSPLSRGILLPRFSL